MTGAQDKRSTVREMVGAGMSLTRACRSLATSRSSVTYRAKLKGDEELIAEIERVRKQKPRWGQVRVHHLLRREGHVVNHKRTERIWKEKGFALPKRRRRRKVRTGRTVPVTALYLHHVWTYDFVFDATTSGRTLKVLTVVDEFSRKALASIPAYRATSENVKRLLAELFIIHGRPAVIRSDNGSEFIAAELTEWLRALGTETYHIEPGKPWQNGYGESFNSRLRDECLDHNEFYGLEHARVVIEAWRCEYNDEHLHSSLGYVTPNEYAAAHAAQTPTGAA